MIFPRGIVGVMRATYGHANFLQIEQSSPDCQIYFGRNREGYSDPDGRKPNELPPIHKSSRMPLERMTQLALCGFSSLVDLGEQRRFNPNSPVRDPLGVRLAFEDSGLSPGCKSLADILSKPWSILPP
jgi:hypothetical protein